MAIVLIATAMRLYRLTAQSMWWDEGHSLFVAGHRLLDIPTIPAMDVHPPLYFWALHVWMALSGRSEFALRFLSLIFGVLTVALMYRVGRELLGPVGGCIAALFAAVSPLYLAYAQEVRMYTLVSLLSLLSMHLFARYMRASTPERSGRLLPYAIATAAGLYAHYFFGFLIILQNAYWLGAVLVSGRWRKRREWLLWIAGQVIILLLLAPQLLTATRQVTSYKNTNLIPPALGEFVVSCWRAFTLGANGGRENPMANAIPWMAAIAAVLIAGLLARYIPRADRRVRGSELSLWMLAFVVPIALYYGVLQDRASFSPRYLIVVTPALYVLLSYAAWQLGRRWLPLGVLGVVVVSAGFLCADRAYYFDPAYAKDETRELARFLEDRAIADDVVFIDVPHPLDYYYRGAAAQRYLFVDINTIADVLNTDCTGKQRLFFVRWRQSDTDPRGAVPFLLEKYGEFRGERDFRGYHVIWYDLPNPVHFSLPTELEPARVNFGDEIWLTGSAYGGHGQGPTSSDSEVQQRQVPAGSMAWATLRWQMPTDACEAADCSIDDLKTAVYLEDERGHKVGQVDKLLLSDRHLRTSGWSPDERAINVYTLPVAPATPPGEYHVMVTVYRTADGEPLPVLDAGGAPEGIAAQIGVLQVVRPDEPPTVSDLSIQTLVERALGDDLVLLGYDAPQRTAEAGTSLPLALYWQAQRNVGTDYSVRLALTDSAGEAVAEIDERPVDGTYPTTNWIAGEVVRDRLAFTPPATVPAGEYELWLGLVPAGTGRPVSELSLGGVTVEGRAHQFEVPPIETPLAANFDGKIGLLGYAETFDGDVLKLTLYWQARGATDASYKVFVHILSPDGKMWAQKDDVPGQGTLPTTGWIEGEVLTDTYGVVFDANVPLQDARIEIGLYDPVSGERLPVVDENGHVIADHIILPN